MAVNAEGVEHAGQPVQGPLQFLMGRPGTVAAGLGQQVQRGIDISSGGVLLQAPGNGLGDLLGLLLNGRLALGPCRGLWLPGGLPYRRVLRQLPYRRFRLLGQLFQNLIRPLYMAFRLEKGGLFLLFPQHLRRGGRRRGRLFPLLLGQGAGSLLGGGQVIQGQVRRPFPPVHRPKTALREGGFPLRFLPWIAVVLVVLLLIVGLVLIAPLCPVLPQTAQCPQNLRWGQMARARQQCQKG